MGFEYNWKNKEANFGPPEPKEVPGGTHITFEIILRKGDTFIALRRPNGIPEHQLPEKAKDYPAGLLYFCHNLIRYGESVEECVARIVKDQAGVSIKNVKVIDIDSFIQSKDRQWAFTPYVIAEIENVPQINNQVTEVVLFDLKNIPDDFAWWTKQELKEFLEEYVR